ncbi:hypothetical protein EC991_007929, partial [Linnemannia zychae]
MAGVSTISSLEPNEDYSDNSNPAYQQPRKPSPLDLPELLDKIFTFVSEPTLAFSVPFVCRQWFILSQRRIIREVVVDTDMTDEELEGALARLRVSRRLYWFTHFMSGEEATERLPQREKVARAIEDKHRRWEEHRVVKQQDPDVDDDNNGHSDDDKKQGEQRPVRWSIREVPLQELIVAGKFMSFDSQLVYMLPFMSQLTVFRVETDHNCEVRLNTVFRACPFLQEVVIRPRKSACNLDPFLDSEDDNHGGGGDWSGNGVERKRSKFTAAEENGPLIHLRTFIIQLFYVDPSTLKDFVSAAPSLTDLQLIQIRASSNSRRPTTFFPSAWFDNDVSVEMAHKTLQDFSDFFKQLMPPLPLKNFHLSVEHFSLETTNPQLLLRLCPGLASSISADNPGFSDQSYRELQNRLQLQLSAGMRNVITVLDLRAALSIASLQGDQLHYYLCESPHLLHLYAPGVLMPVNHMDVYRKLWTTRVNEASPIPGLVRPQPGIWACRKLRTLHMSYTSISANSSWIDCVGRPLDEPNDARKCRLFFGYLSIVCPALEDLWLDMIPLVGEDFMLGARHLELRMGFVLLTRLRVLERLTFKVLKPIRAGGWRPVMRLPNYVEIEWMRVRDDDDEGGGINSLERIKARRRELMKDQNWEYFIRLECERDSLIREQHQRCLEIFWTNVYLPSRPDPPASPLPTPTLPPRSSRPLFSFPPGVPAVAKLAGVVGGRSNRSIAEIGSSSNQQDVSIKFLTPPKCHDYDDIFEKLKNQGLLLDVKLLLEEMEASQDDNDDD